MLVVANFTPVPRENYIVGVPKSGLMARTAQQRRHALWRQWCRQSGRGRHGAAVGARPVPCAEPADSAARLMLVLQHDGEQGLMAAAKTASKPAASPKKADKAVRKAADKPAGTSADHLPREAAQAAVVVQPFEVADGRVRVVIESITPSVDSRALSQSSVWWATRVRGRSRLFRRRPRCGRRGAPLAPLQTKPSWHRTPMVALGNDRWRCSFDVDQLGYLAVPGSGLGRPVPVVAARLQAPHRARRRAHRGVDRRGC